MPTYVVYDPHDGTVLWLAVQPTRPALPDASKAYIQVPDGTTIDTGKWSVIGGVLLPFSPAFVDNRAAKLAAAEDYYTSLITPPSGFLYGGNLYEIDQNGQINIDALTTIAVAVDRGAAVTWPSGFTWTTLDGQQVTMTAADMMAFGAAVAFYVHDLLSNLDSIQAAIRACTTQAALDAVDITAGYPSGSGALIQALYALPFEALGVSPVSATFALPLETRESAGAAFALPLETRQAVGVTYPLPFESRLDDVGVILPLPLETQ